MPYDGNGVFTRVGNSFSVPSQGTVIDPADAEALFDDLDAALSAPELENATGLPLTTGVTGTLPVANGGTNIASYAVGDLLYASGATTLAKLAGVAAGQPVISGGITTAPLYSGVWSTFNTASTRLQLSRGATAFSAAGTTSLHVQGADTGEARIELTASSSDSVVVFGRLNGGFGTRNPVAASDQIMGLVTVGIDTAGGTTMQQGGTIGAFATATWSSTSHPTDFRFNTIATGTTSFIEAMRLLDSGGAWLSRNATAPNSVAAGTPTLQLHAANSADNLLV